MTTKAVAFLMLRLAYHPSDQHVAHLELLAAHIIRASEHYQLDALLVTAVIWRESSFIVHKVGKKGERGLGQLKRGTLATHGYDHLSDEALDRVPLNVMLTARHLDHVRSLCGGAGAKPEGWLSVYAGHRRCRPSPYSRKVLATFADLTGWSEENRTRDEAQTPVVERREVAAER